MIDLSNDFGAFVMIVKHFVCHLVFIVLPF